MSFLRTSCPRTLRISSTISTSLLPPLSRPFACPRPRVPDTRHFSAGRTRSTRYNRFGSGSSGSRSPFQPFGEGNSQNNAQFATLIAVGIGGGLVVYYVSHLDKVPETGRWRFMDTSPKKEAQLGKEMALELLHTSKGHLLPDNHPVTRHVQSIVDRILLANDLGVSEVANVHRVHLQGTRPGAEQEIVNEAGEGKGEGGRKRWMVWVVDRPEVVNAAVTFGNIIVFTGILSVTKDDDGLAAVLSHEIGHEVARHLSEKRSSARVLDILSNLMVLFNIDAGLTRLLMGFLLELPNSRVQELEADMIGLRLAAKACFDPRGAPDMFRRMGAYEKKAGGGILTEVPFLRTHPTTDTRIQKLESMLPDAYAIRASSDCPDPSLVDAFRAMGAGWASSGDFGNAESMEGEVGWKWV